MSNDPPQTEAETQMPQESTPDEIWCEVCRDVHSQGGPHAGELPPQTEAETLISRLREMADRYVGGSQSYELLYLLREAADALTIALCERDDREWTISELRRQLSNSQFDHTECVRRETAAKEQLATALRERDEARADIQAVADDLTAENEDAHRKLEAAERERDEAIQQATKTVEFHRDMAARFAEDRDAQKHLAREYKAQLLAAGLSPRHE